MLLQMLLTNLATMITIMINERMMIRIRTVSYTHLTLPTNREV